MSAWTGFTFVGYFTPIRELAGLAVSGGLGPWESFWIGFYGLATYGNAGWMREQFCKHACPYERFQSAMFDKDTLVVAYDEKLGEKRGEGKGDRKGLGDCIDCKLCVQVCPVGIDIRDGLQYECIGCGACVDACDTVMDRVGLPKGLVRYATQNSMKNGWSAREIWRRMVRAKVVGYAMVFTAVCVAMAWGLSSRLLFRVDVERDRGAMAREVGAGWVENVYRFQIMNAAEKDAEFEFSVEGLLGLKIENNASTRVGPVESKGVSVTVSAPRGAASPGAHPIEFVIFSKNGLGTKREKSVFFGPR